MQPCRKDTLARLFRYGNVTYHGGFVNLREGGAARLSVDPLLWRRLKRRSKGKPSKT